MKEWKELGEERASIRRVEKEREEEMNEPEELLPPHLHSLDQRVLRLLLHPRNSHAADLELGVPSTELIGHDLRKEIVATRRRRERKDQLVFPPLHRQSLLLLYEAQRKQNSPLPSADKIAKQKAEARKGQRTDSIDQTIFLLELRPKETHLGERVGVGRVRRLRVFRDGKLVHWTRLEGKSGESDRGSESEVGESELSRGFEDVVGLQRGERRTKVSEAL